MNPIQEISKIALELTGIQLTEKHSAMIQSRLQKRLRQLEIPDISSYLPYLRSHWEEESRFLIGALTTHHTYFFREFSHFEYLSGKTLQHLITQARKRPSKSIRVWSAACSRGQEVYSLAMWLEAALKSTAPDVKLDILGTDVDPESVAIASNGVYPWREVKEIPLQFLNSSWSRGKGEIAEFAKIKGPLRKFCRFDTQNLLDLNLKNESPFDLIFCRNVFIYFNQDQIKKITQSLLDRMSPEGFLFLGISESLHGSQLPIQTLAPSTYVKAEHSWVKAAPVKPAEATTRGVPAALPQVIAETPIRILVVDDSPSIQTLMKQVFTKESGFEIVGTATNGLEAAEKLKTLQVDAMTLDIHMPEQNGVEYLQKNMGSLHPPVIMVSSVSREDSTLASRALELGASDYVEKPSLSNLKERADEIRAKIRCAVRARKVSSGAPALSLDRSFQKEMRIENPENKLRIIICQGSDLQRVSSLLAKWTIGAQPPAIVVLDGSSAGFEVMRNRWESALKAGFKGEDDLKSGPAPTAGRYLLGLTDTAKSKIADLLKTKTTSMLILGEPSTNMTSWLRSLHGPNLHSVSEDQGQAGGATNPLRGWTRDIQPFTSFAYTSDQFLIENKTKKAA